MSHIDVVTSRNPRLRYALDLPQHIQNHQFVTVALSDPIFTVGFYNKIPTGALLLVSDSPMVPEGVKSEASDKKVTSAFVERHLKIGIDSLKQLINDGLTVRHLKF